MKNCPKCGSEHNKFGLFCSRSCANSRGPRTDAFKKQVSEKLTGKKGHPNPLRGKHLVERVIKSCMNCGLQFETLLKKPGKYCSNNCWKKQSGGYREGSGRAKIGYYKGIYCGSTYELVWVIYHLDHNVEFIRFPGSLEKDGIKYYPDFLLGNLIIEIKGYETQTIVDIKSNVAESYGYTVSVLRKEDLEKEFSWVRQKYQYKELYELYDDYKPKYNLICSNCNSEFFRDSKPKTDVVFCSRLCAGKGHKGRVKSL